MIVETLKIFFFIIWSLSEKFRLRGLQKHIFILNIFKLYLLIKKIVKICLFALPKNFGNFIYAMVSQNVELRDLMYYHLSLYFLLILIKF